MSDAGCTAWTVPCAAPVLRSRPARSNVKEMSASLAREYARIPSYPRSSITSSKSTGACPTDATLTIRAGADRESSANSSRVKKEGREVVDGEAELIPVGAHLTRRPREAASQRGVVHEHVEPRLVALDLPRETSDRVERGQVGPIAVHAGAAAAPPDVVLGRCQALRASAMQQHRRAPYGELARERVAEAVGGAGDEDRLLVDRKHRGQGVNCVARHMVPGPGGPRLDTCFGRA